MNNNANINISKDVLSTIISVAANEVDGVAGIAHPLSANNMTKLLKKQNPLAGITLNINEESNEIDIEVLISIKFGYELKPVAEKVQDKIKNAIETMTNLVATSINVNVANIKEVTKE